MLKAELSQALQNSELGKNLDPQEIEMMIHYNQVITFEVGDIILSQGKKSEGIYIIINGNVAVAANMLAERTINLETLGPGNFIGEISFIEKGPCAASVVANHHVTCLYITDIYAELISNYYPETEYKIFSIIAKQICNRLKVMHNKIIAYITDSDMMKRSFFSEVMHKLTKPKKITFQEIKMSIEQLHQFFSFSTFNNDEINELINHTVILQAPKNCTLITEGERMPSCYIVIYGAVQSSIIKNNKIAKLSVIGPKTLFASTACIDRLADYTLNFTTCEKAILLKFSMSDLEYFQNNQANIWYKLFNLICHSLAALEKSIDKLDVRLQIEEYNR